MVRTNSPFLKNLLLFKLLSWYEIQHFEPTTEKHSEVFLTLAFTSRQTHTVKEQARKMIDKTQVSEAFS